MILYHFQDSIKKAGVLSFPGTWLFELPAVDDIAVQDEIFTVILLEKPCDLFGFGAFSTQMDIGYYYRFELGFHSSGFDWKV